MKVAIIHDWLIVLGGAEKVLGDIIDCYPEADLYSVIDFMAEADRSEIRGRRARTTFIQKLPFAKRLYKAYLPLMPIAIEQLDLSGYDLIVSSSHAVAKGVIVAPDQVHVCYCHSPMRYVWDLQHEYLAEFGLDKGLRSALMRLFFHRLRLWDGQSATRVSAFVANSQFIRRRIKRCYGRDAAVIPPPVDVTRFELSTDSVRDDFYMTASRMVPYKKIDVIVEAFRSMPDRRLVVIGDGPELERIKAMAPDNVMLMGRQPDDVLKRHMQRARAFIFAAHEDFGIVPVEAQACGAPVIAFGQGGALETVVGSGTGRTGVFFPEQTADSVAAAVRAFEEMPSPPLPEVCRENALRFSGDRFRSDLASFVAKAYEDHRWG